MPCDQKQTQTTRKKNKDGDVITTHTSKRVCANDVEDIREEENEEEQVADKAANDDEEDQEEEVLTEEKVKQIFQRFL